MHLELALIVSALGGPLPAFLSPDPRDAPAPLVDDGPAFIVGAATATEPTLANSGRAGPVRTNDLNPLHTVYLQLAPERAEVLRAGRFSLGLNVARTNSMEGRRREEGGPGLLHAETTRTELTARLGLGGGLEAQLSMPWVDRHAPAMDDFIGWVEVTSWMKRMMPSRQRYQGTPGAYELDIPGEGPMRGSVYDAGSGDTSLQLKGKLWNEGRYLPAVSLRGAVKAPTGDWTRGFGSQTWDLAVGLSFEKAIWPWISVYGTVAGTLPFSPSPYVKAFAMASLAVEAILNPAMSVVLQFNTHSSPYRGTGIGILDGRDDLWIAALNARVPVFGHDVRFSLYLVENVCLFPGEKWSGSAHDFTVGMTMAVEPPERAF